MALDLRGLVARAGLWEFAGAVQVALAQRCSGRGLLAALFGAACGRVLWWQYSVLLTPNLPTYSFEWPLLAANFGVFYRGYNDWARSVLNGASSRLMNFYGFNAVMVSWRVYEKFVKKADNGGELDPGQLPESMKCMLGESSILLLKAGKGQHRHHRLRSKVLASLTPKRVLAQVDNMAVVIRGVLDKMVEETRSMGFSKFHDHSADIPRKITVVPIVGSLPEVMQQRISELLDAFVGGFVAVGVDLGRWSAYGRAMRARRELEGIVKEMFNNIEEHQGEMIAELAAKSAEGEGFSEMEMLDTVLTLLFAGFFTTNESMPPLLVELARRPEWAAKIAAEPLQFDQVEGDSNTANFVREVLRHYPPENMFIRSAKKCPVDLGEHGHVPAGCNILANFGEAMWGMGSDFNPDRWTPDTVRDLFLTFGGHSPHSCVGRSIAMVELQLFARIVCREYDVEVLDETRVRNWAMGGITHMYRGGLKVRVSRRP